MATPLATLLAGQTPAQVYQTLLALYQAQGFPVQSWQAGGVEETRLLAFATVLSDLYSNYAPAIAGQGFLDYSVSPSLPVLSSEFYNLPQNLAVFTQGNITGTVASGAGPYPYTAGQLIAVYAATGNRYINVNSGTLNAGPSTNANILFKAEFAGASYNDPSNSGALTLVTPLPGVTLTNPAGTYSSVTHVGAGTGTLTLAGSPSVPHQVVVTITSTGAAGAATWAYSLDGGALVLAGSAIGPTAIGASGIAVTLVGALGTSFIQNDTYTFAAPGSWITQQGADIESDPNLQGRCRNRWGSLATVPTQSLYKLLATTTPGVGAQVTQCVVIPDQYVNNKVNIIIAGPAGVLPSSTISAVQTYITPRTRGCDNPVVQSPTTLATTIAATITVNASQLSTATAAITTALNNYIANTQINGTLRIAAIVDLVMNIPGVVDCSGVTINGAASNLALGSLSSFVIPAYPPTLSLSYVTV